MIIPINELEQVESITFFENGNDGESIESTLERTSGVYESDYEGPGRASIEFSYERGSGSRDFANERGGGSRSFSGKRGNGSRSDDFDNIDLKYVISEEKLQHASLGNFNSNDRMSGGGHGQVNIEYLLENNIEFHILKEYDNGVRIGNVPDHKSKMKATGVGQAWFPEDWTESDIKKAGEYVANMPENIDAPDGTWVFGEYNGVRIGKIKNDGKIGTIVPDNLRQPR